MLFTALHARAGEQQRLQSFVENNLIGIFYHELGHALVDVANVPIYGQEEDAADVFSIFLINELYEEETARQLAMDASMGFLAELLSAEISELNKDFRFPVALDVTIEACDEPNAFYDPETRTIVMCEEFVPHLEAVAAQVMD